MSHATRTTPPGFTPVTSWQDVLSSKVGDAFYYWGALMARPGNVRICRVFKNGKVRVMDNSGATYVFDAGNLPLLYRSTTPERPLGAK